jgi:hypothetical protein
MREQARGGRRLRLAVGLSVLIREAVGGGGRRALAAIGGDAHGACRSPLASAGSRTDCTTDRPCRSPRTPSGSGRSRVASDSACAASTRALASLSVFIACYSPFSYLRRSEGLDSHPLAPQ